MWARLNKLGNYFHHYYYCYALINCAVINLVMSPLTNAYKEQGADERSYHCF